MNQQSTITTKTKTKLMNDVLVDLALTFSNFHSLYSFEVQFDRCFLFEEEDNQECISNESKFVNSVISYHTTEEN
jgi:hypothetical protein